MSSGQSAFRRLGLVWALAAVAGCDSTQPGVETAYTLQTLNESPLPYDQQGLGCCVYLSGDLRLAQGRYTVSITARNRNSGLVFTAKEWGTYAQQLSTLSFTADSFAVSPLGLDVGTLTDSGLQVAFGGEGPGSPDQFHAFFVLRE